MIERRRPRALRLQMRMSSADIRQLLSLSLSACDRSGREHRRTSADNPCPILRGLNTSVISKRWVACQSPAASARFRTIQICP